MRRGGGNPFPGKFKPKKTVVDGIKFPSFTEACRYGQLKLSQSAGRIRDLQCQPRLPMVINGIKIGVGYYKADFSYDEFVDGEWRKQYEDVKGEVELYAAKIRRQVAEACNGVIIQVVSM